MIKRNDKGQFKKGFKVPEGWREKTRDRKIGIRFAPQYEFKKGHLPWNYKGEILDADGYIMLYKPDYKSPRKRKKIYISRSIYIMEKELKRYLKKDELVHHINGIRNDDRLKNLYLFNSRKAHMDYEGKVLRTYKKWIQQGYNLESFNKNTL